MSIGNNIELQTDEKNIKVCTWLEHMFSNICFQNQISGTTNVLLIKRKFEHHYKEILIVTWKWSISIFSLLPRGASRRSSLWGRGHLSTCLLHRHICQRCQRSAPTSTPMAPACHNSINKLNHLRKSIFWKKLWWILWDKLGTKIEPKSINNRIEKAMKKWVGTPTFLGWLEIWLL